MDFIHKVGHILIWIPKFILNTLFFFHKKILKFVKKLYNFNNSINQEYKIEEDVFFFISVMIFALVFFSTVNFPLLSPEWNISASTQTLAALIALIIAGYSFNNQSLITKQSNVSDIDEDYNIIMDENYARFSFIILISTITIVYNLFVLISIKNGDNIIFNVIEKIHIHNSFSLTIATIIMNGIFTVKLFNYKRVEKKTQDRKTDFDQDSSLENVGHFLKVFNELEQLLLTYYINRYGPLDSRNNRLSYVVNILKNDIHLSSKIHQINEMRYYRNKIVHNPTDVGASSDAIKEMEKLIEYIKQS